VCQTTGYIPPNKNANETILADFYKNTPKKETAIRQLPQLRDWQANHSDKGLVITQVSIVVGDANDMKSLQQEVVKEVNYLLP